MLFRAAERLDVYPMSEVVVVDDTRVGIEAGLNAGAWTVAITRTGNSLGLSVDELARLDRDDLAARLESAAEEFRRAGAHRVIESVADLLQVLDGIEFLAASDRQVKRLPDPESCRRASRIPLRSSAQAVHRQTPRRRRTLAASSNSSELVGHTRGDLTPKQLEMVRVWALL